MGSARHTRLGRLQAAKLRRPFPATILAHLARSFQTMQPHGMEAVTMEIIINGNTVNGTASELAKLLAVMDTATEAANGLTTSQYVTAPKP